MNSKKTASVVLAGFVSGICLLAACATSVFAQAEAGLPVFEETELMFIGEELYTVSIASRKAEPLRRAPAAVTVISEEELKKYRTLSEVLRRVPGFFIDRNEIKERIYLRGVPDSFLVMMDGVPFSSDASTIDYPRGMELSLDYIEKIEIIRGPGSALWGPDAFSGIINLVTKKGEQLQGGVIKGEAGSYDTVRTSIQAGFAKNGWDGFGFASYAHTEGFEKDLPGKQRRRDDRFGELYGKLSYRDLFEISGRYSHYRDFYSNRIFAYEGSEHKPFSFVQASVNKSFESSALFMQGWYQYFDSLDDYDQSRYEQRNEQYGLELKYDRELFENNFATLGTSFRYNDGSTTRFKSQGLSFVYFPSYDTDLVSLYFQDKWKLTDNLETTIGVRYDNHSDYDDCYSPRFGINYLFWERCNLKLLYGRAFRTPSLAVVIQDSGLDPEQIDSYEIEAGYHYKDIFSLEANYFYNELDDIIENDALGRVTNTGSEHIKGVEISARWKPHSSVALYANYSHLFGDRQKGLQARQQNPDPENPDQPIETTIESFLNVAPDTICNAGVDYYFLSHFRLNVEMNYVDQRKLSREYQTIVTTSAEGALRRQTIRSRRHVSSYLLFDVNLFITDLPVKNTEITFKIKNIFDKDYRTRGIYELIEDEGSSMYLVLRYRF